MFKKILLALLAVALAAAAYLWLNRDRIASDFNQQREAESKAFHAAGREYGLKHNQQECLDKALTDFDTQCTGFSCTVRYGKFLHSCLQSAQPDPEFCRDVPPFHEEKTEEDKNWARETCWGRDIRGEGCRILLRQQQQFCSKGVAEGAAPSPGD